MKNPFIEINRRLSAIEKRLNSLFIVGSVVQADYDRGTIQVSDGTEYKSAHIPWVGQKSKGVTNFDAPEIGQKMIVMNNGQQAFSIMGGFSNEGKKNGNDPKVKRIDFADGAFFEYDQNSGNGLLNLSTSLKITISGVSINIADGKITINGADMILPSHDVVAKGHSLDHHKHPGITPGPAVTGPAIP